MSSTNSGSEPSPAAALDVPVTLVVELGRVNLPLSRLADLKTGDVVELARHSRAGRINLRRTHSSPAANLS